MDERPKCDVCGKPATNAARDVYQRDSWGGYLEFTPDDHVKFGCDEHKTTSNQIDVSTILTPPQPWR